MVTEQRVSCLAVTGYDFTRHLPAFTEYDAEVFVW